MLPIRWKWVKLYRHIQGKEGGNSMELTQTWKTVLENSMM